MDITCPQCGHSGTIGDGLVPNEGRSINCKKCQHSFFISSAPSTGENPVQNPSPIPPQFPAFENPPRPGGTSGRDSNRLVRLVLIIFAIVVAFSLGFYIGYFMQNGNAIKDLGLLSDRETEEGKIAPPSDATEAPNADLPDEPPPAETEAPPTPNDTVAPPPGEGATPVIKASPGPVSVLTLPEGSSSWDDYSSDIFVTVDEIEGTTRNLAESNYTLIQRERELYTYGNGILGLMFSGKLTVSDVRNAITFNVEDPMENDAFPNKNYFFVIEAKDAGDGTSRCLIKVGIREDAEDLVISLRRGSGIYVEGVIYAYRVVKEVYEITLINARVEKMY